MKPIAKLLEFLFVHVFIVIVLVRFLAFGFWIFFYFIFVCLFVLSMFFFSDSFSNLPNFLCLTHLPGLFLLFLMWSHLVTLACSGFPPYSLQQKQFQDLSRDCFEIKINDTANISYLIFILLLLQMQGTITLVYKYGGNLLLM